MCCPTATPARGAVSPQGGARPPALCPGSGPPGADTPSSGQMLALPRPGGDLILQGREGSRPGLWHPGASRQRAGRVSQPARCQPALIFPPKAAEPGPGVVQPETLSPSDDPSQRGSSCSA